MKLVEKIDYLHIKMVIDDPMLENPQGDLVHFVCKITVVHNDGSMYIQYPYDAIVDVTSDQQVAAGLIASHDACRDRLLSIVLEYRKQQRELTKNTISTAQFRRKK